MPRPFQRSKPAPLLLLALACVCCACNDPVPPTPRTSSNTVATVGDAIITSTELTRAMTQGGAARYQTAESRQALLEQLVQRAVEVQAAKAAGYDRSPEVVKTYEHALVAELRRQQLDPEVAAVTVTDAEVAERYRNHSSEFTLPARMRAAVIRVSVPPRASPEKRKQLAKRAAEAREAALALPAATPTFGSVAVKYSDDQATRYRGGDTGWTEVEQHRSRWPPEVLAALLAIPEPGEIAPLITTATGHYLVRLLGREAAAPRPLEEVSTQIRHQLLADKKTEVEARFRAALRKDIPVSIDTERLRSVPAPKIWETEATRPPSLPE